MRRLAVLAAIIVGGLGAALTTSGLTAQGGGGLPGITAIEQIHGNVYKIFGAGGNTTVFVRANDVVLVDTKLPNSGESILAEVRKITDKPIGMVINTHSHPDHTGSNAFFTAEDRVQVVAHANSATRMGQASGPFPALEVDQSFDDRLSVGEGGDRVDLYYFGPGHTDGDALVVFPAERTMAAGDIYAWHMSPLIDPGSGGSMIALPTTLTQAEYTIKDVDTVITGHGPAVTWDEFKSYVKFNRALVQTAEETLAGGGDEQAALEALKREPSHMIFLGTELLPGLEYGGTPESRALINLMVAFQELRGEEPQLIMGLPPRDSAGQGPGQEQPQGQPPGGDSN
jgi:glyoxylase-like metal-dependent hydrolase (beta-lactamase superfamily II)